MKILFVNLPNIKQDAAGNVIEVGPQSGSRWPWRGMTPGCYAPVPFYITFCVSYLHAFGIECDFVDCVAEGRWHPSQWPIYCNTSADAIVFEVSMPIIKYALKEAEEAKFLGKRVVLCGPHCASASEELAALPYIDHVIIGEYEVPMMEIANGSTQKIFRYQHVDNLDMANGKIWHPYRDPRLFSEYFEPTCNTGKSQLTLYTSRGCFAACKYCSFPKTMNNRTYRARSAPVVIDEIHTAIASAKASGLKLGNTWTWGDGKNTPDQTNEIRSILFDDDTAFVGVERTKELLAGLKAIGLPWSAMTRIDIHRPELYDLMMDAGMVALRAGIESFQQHVVETTNGFRNAKKQYEMLHYLTGRFTGKEFHLTSMRDMPGQTEADWQKDQEIFNELKARAEQHGNKFHWQVSRTVPFPGTDLYDEIVAAGHKKILDAYDYNGTGGETELNRIVRTHLPLATRLEVLK